MVRVERICICFCIMSESNLNFTRRWSDSECRSLLDFWASNIRAYKGGVKKKFYSAAVHFPGLEKKSMDQVRTKCQDVERRYKDMHQKLTTTGFGLESEDDARTLHEWVIKKFPLYYEVHDFMGERASINPPAVLETSVGANAHASAASPASATTAADEDASLTAHAQERPSAVSSGEKDTPTVTVPIDVSSGTDVSASSATVDDPSASSVLPDLDDGSASPLPDPPAPTANADTSRTSASKRKRHYTDALSEVLLELGSKNLAFEQKKFEKTMQMNARQLEFQQLKLQRSLDLAIAHHQADMEVRRSKLELMMKQLRNDGEEKSQ